MSYLRRLLWRWLRIPLPAVPGWRERIHVVRDALERGEVPVCPETGVIGTVLRWTGFRRTPEGLEPEPGLVDAWTGAPIQALPEYRDDGSIVGATFAVRCARCGVAVSATTAGMRSEVDVPSCPPCRSSVRRERSTGGRSE